MCCWGVLRACAAECGYGGGEFAAEEHYRRQRRTCCVGAAMAYGSVFLCVEVAATCFLALGLLVYVAAVYGPTARLALQ